jgi:hypothetical protein
MIRYSFRDGPCGFHKNDLDPDKVGAELCRLSRTPDGCRPEILWELAKDPSCSFHTAVTWDKDAAAYAHQLGQLREMVAAVRIIEVKDAAPRRAFISISPAGEKRGYYFTPDVRTAVHLHQYVLEAAKRDLEAWIDRYRELVDLCKVAATIITALETRMAASAPPAPPPAE